MKKFDKFYFERFSFDRETFIASFFYSFDKELYFEEKIDFSSKYFSFREDIDYEVLENILSHLHIALGISYYKSFPTKKLVLESVSLDDKQISFWKKFYKNGLGEFLYRNHISPEGLFDFTNTSGKIYNKKGFEISEKYLVPIGGGKDSLVSMSLLKDAFIDFDNFIFGKSDRIKDNCLKVEGKNPLLVKRTISPKLIELNNAGYYNGHVPITGIIAFVMLVVGYIYDYKYLVLSNEKSAEEGNLSWAGFEINHQYSKSLEFEKDFDSYTSAYISSDMKYFSLLRGIYEYKIAEIFSQKSQKYFKFFSSCNNNFKIDEKKRLVGGNWCKSCPKCVFVFTILSAFLSKDDLLEIFGDDLYAKEDLENLFRELLGISGNKPFECVGESEEMILAMKKSLEKSRAMGDISYMLKIFEKDIISKFKNDDFVKMENKLLKIYDEDIIPKCIKDEVFSRK